MGFLLTIWVVIKVYTATPKPGYEALYSWLYYQVIILFVGLGLMVLVFICFFTLYRRHRRAKAHAQKVADAK
jgi:Na+/melibiose symporter-like transporter